MNRHERWILEVAVTLRQPVRALTSDHVESWFNRRHHGLDSAGVASVLRQLLRERLIVLSLRDGQPLLDHDQELRLEEDACGDSNATPIYYGLTAAGGVAWEEVACPNWDRYIDGSFGIEPDEGVVICADPARAEGYVFSPYQDRTPLPNSVRRDRLEPWPATYWKTLPSGHRITFLYDSTSPVLPEYGADAWVKKQAWLEDANHWFIPDAP